jgi:hypothetical protein
VRIASHTAQAVHAPAFTSGELCQDIASISVQQALWGALVFHSRQHQALAMVNQAHYVHTVVAVCTNINACWPAGCVRHS